MTIVKNTRIVGTKKPYTGKKGVVKNSKTVGTRREYEILFDGSTEGVRLTKDFFKQDKPGAVPLPLFNNNDEEEDAVAIEDLYKDLEDINVEDQAGGDNAVRMNEESQGGVNLNNFNTSASTPSITENVMTHGRRWTLVEDVTDDPSANTAPDYQPTTAWDQVEGDKPPHFYFEQVFPMDKLESYVSTTNKNLEAKGFAATNADEFLRFIMIRLYICLEFDEGDIDNFWSTKPLSKGMKAAPCFGKRFKMGRRRFEILNANIQFGELPFENPWSPVAQFVEDFNNHMKKIYTPGNYICVDELFSYWLGKELKYSVKGAPHITKIKAKPRGVGICFKCSADAQTKVILKLEIQEGKEAMAQKEFQLNTATNTQSSASNDKYQYSTAVTLRLCKPYFGTNRIVLGDAGFGSTTTAIALRHKGLHFIGKVKKISKMYPKDVLSKWSSNEDTNLGDHRVYVSKSGNDTIMAVAWANPDSMFVSTTGVTTADAADDRREPLLIKQYHQGSGAVDNNNQYRQGILKVEEHWRVKHYRVRVSTTILGIILTNAFLLRKYDRSKSDPNDRVNDPEHFRQFVALLCHHYLVENEEEDDDDIMELHELVKLVEHPLYRKMRKPQSKCKHCPQKCSTYCKQCSTDYSVYPVHKNRPEKARHCHDHHIEAFNLH